jgi:hypothetical protein
MVSPGVASPVLQHGQWSVVKGSGLGSGSGGSMGEDVQVAGVDVRVGFCLLYRMSFPSYIFTCLKTGNVSKFLSKCSCAV